MKLSGSDQKTSKAQIKASRAWEERNRDYARKMSYRRSGRNFILRLSTEKDLKEVESWIKERREILRK